AELSERVRSCVEPERTAYALRKHAQQFIALENVVGVLLARHDAAELGHEIGQKRKFRQARMNEEARDPAGAADERVQRHDAVERHEASMHANQHATPLRRHVLEADDLDPPVVLMQQVKQMPAVASDVSRIHAERVELPRRHICATLAGVAANQLENRARTCTRRLEAELAANLLA